MILFYPRRKRHFRGHATRNGSHPCYIVGETSSTYLYFGLTHARKKGKGHANYRLSVTPRKATPAPHTFGRRFAKMKKGGSP